MLNLGCEDGSLFFRPDEWRTPKQIQRFFSRLSSQQRRNELPLNEDDAEALDERLMHTQISNEVFASVKKIILQRVKHLYSLLKQGMLAKLKLAELKKICQYFATELGIGSTRRQNAFPKPITDLLCSYVLLLCCEFLVGVCNEV